jgi:UDP-N-acetylmuramyl pentapeptide phosphotransferase/UDP-N-acetylglucosamine-1-phosphate transferase
MMVPRLDTASVSVSRMATGKPISRRGLDHSHHRLLALALSHQRALSVVSGVAAVTAGCAVPPAAMPQAYVVAMVPLIAAVFGLVGLFVVELTFDSQPSGIAYGYLQRVGAG